MSLIEQYFSYFITFPLILNVWIQKLVANLAFWPHRPSYDLVALPRMEGSPFSSKNYEFHLNEKAATILAPFKFYKYQQLMDRYQREGQIQCFYVSTCRGNQVVCLKMDYKQNMNRRGELNDPYTIVYSHSNGCDLGVIIRFLWKMAKKCECTVVAYDYSGYGRSTGKPSERNIYSDIEAVVKTLVNDYKIQLGSIVLYGESIGTAPTLHLASRLWVAGVILHAPIKSGLKAYFNNGQRCWLFDPFPNIHNIERVLTPVLVIHGFNDTIADISHGIALYQKSRYKCRPLWLKEANHNDVRIYAPFYRRIQYFLKECDRFKFQYD